MYGSLEVTDYQVQPEGSTPLLKKISTKTVNKGDVDGPALIHQVRNVSDKNAIGLHLYASPLQQCTVYDLQTNQVKKMTIVSHSMQGKLIEPEKK